MTDEAEQEFAGIVIDERLDANGVPTAHAALTLHSIAVLLDTDFGDMSRVRERARRDVLRYAALKASMALGRDPLLWLEVGDRVQPPAEEPPGIVTMIDYGSSLVAIQWHGGGSLTVTGAQLLDEFQRGNWTLP